MSSSRVPISSRNSRASASTDGSPKSIPPPNGRRILEPVATGMAATRLTEDDYAALEICLARMDEAETTQAFIAADEEFHRIIATASGNTTLASLIQHLSGGTVRARLWRSVTEQGAVETTK